MVDNLRAPELPLRISADFSSASYLQQADGQLAIGEQALGPLGWRGLVRRLSTLRGRCGSLRGGVEGGLDRVQVDPVGFEHGNQRSARTEADGDIARDVAIRAGQRQAMQGGAIGGVAQRPLQGDRLQRRQRPSRQRRQRGEVGNLRREGQIGSRQRTGIGQGALGGECRARGLQGHVQRERSRCGARQ